MTSARERAGQRWRAPVAQTASPPPDPVRWREPAFIEIDGVWWLDSCDMRRLPLPVPPSEGSLAGVTTIRGRMVRTERLSDPCPERITCALDVRGLQGPQVDWACGVEEPAVDMWEAGTLVPNEVEVRRLATLTGMLPCWFYDPMPLHRPGDGPIFICTRGSFDRYLSGKGDDPGRVDPLDWGCGRAPKPDPVLGPPV